MKSINELRGNISFNVQEVSASFKYILKQKLDFDIFLPSIGKNLQRDLVWSLFQKREIILSVLLEINIPHISIINTWKKDVSEIEIWQIIDGKQRLSSMIEFVNDKFTIEIENEEYLFSQLPEEYQKEILRFNIRYNVVYEMENEISDQEKINWFKLINFAGTPQDIEHINNLK